MSDFSGPEIGSGTIDTAIMDVVIEILKSHNCNYTMTNTHIIRITNYNGFSYYISFLSDHICISHYHYYSKDDINDEQIYIFYGDPNSLDIIIGNVNEICRVIKSWCGLYGQ